MTRRPFLLPLLLTTVVAPGLLAGQESRERRVLVWRDGGAQTFEIDERIGTRTWLGVTTIGLTPELLTHFGVAERHGVMIASLADDGPALRAGLEIGDVILDVAGDAITDPPQLAATVRGRPPERTTVAVSRGGRRLAFDVDLDLRRVGSFDVGPMLEPGVGTAGFDVEIIGGDPGTGEVVRRVVLDARRQLGEPIVLRQLEHLGADRRELREEIDRLKQQLRELEAEIRRLTDDR